ncbi:hypothetical protein C6H88_02570 [Chlamydia muridarum str. Nigg]|uniref:Uncharacterized protein n=1 Tax=Chlamydia muridarum TaxID=83560 RepID=A0A069ZSE1_CHLMR|nr:hypothetical protein TAC_02630 [Chlamydia muridarum str. Nigg3 CMUT3-5]AHH23810.1 hypothetical protein Y015_02630 [Chlamydia muridarum str. Nigg CM972]AID38019.1 hypothetical protein BB17_02675 [Chlamydia muridarum str. Nigg 2 MCR]AIT90681.1 hypothetical protein NC80_02500 [Chlamydia muridarum]AVM88247.1 hypothetical protein C6H96_02570 [Chlamydia muridarum str. Nigg]UFW99753.1 hypothetical protein FTM85_02675 [Chlamydia trachomatis]
MIPNHCNSWIKNIFVKIYFAIMLITSQYLVLGRISFVRQSRPVFFEGKTFQKRTEFEQSFLVRRKK